MKELEVRETQEVSRFNCVVIINKLSNDTRVELYIDHLIQINYIVITVYIVVVSYCNNIGFVYQNIFLKKTPDLQALKVGVIVMNL